ncbi:hypothetical protein PFISCL1PPCAC_5367, partial [Pristionchus fissidentatus]
MRWVTLIISIASIALGAAQQHTIVIHFLETTPSILRCSVIVLLYIPLKVSLLSGHRIFDKHMHLNVISQTALYGYHLIIILITLARSKSKLPFSLYLFDLMPT